MITGLACEVYYLYQRHRFHTADARSAQGSRQREGRPYVVASIQAAGARSVPHLIGSAYCAEQQLTVLGSHRQQIGSAQALTVVRRAGAAGLPWPAAPLSPHRPRGHKGRICSGIAALDRPAALQPTRRRHRLSTATAALGDRQPGDPTQPDRAPGSAAPRAADAGAPLAGVGPRPDTGLAAESEPSSQLGRQVGLTLFALAAAGVVTLTLRSGLSPAAAVARLEAIVDASGPAGPALFVAAYGVSTTLFFPAALLTLGAGARLAPCMPLRSRVAGNKAEPLGVPWAQRCKGDGSLITRTVQTACVSSHSCAEPVCLHVGTYLCLMSLWWILVSRYLCVGMQVCAHLPL